MAMDFEDEILEENLPCKSAIAPVSSDGGRSSYYNLTIHTKEGDFECVAGDIIRSVFGNDFDYGNAFKALVRMYQLQQGKGKAGTSLEYDANKVGYFVGQILENNNGSR